MSNGAEVLLARPMKHGWRAERILSVECLNQYRSAERIFNVLFEKIRTESERNPEKKVAFLSVAAHALHAAARSCGISINADDFSLFGPEERVMMKEYDKMLMKNIKQVKRDETDVEEEAFQQDFNNLKVRQRKSNIKESLADKRKRLKKQKEERDSRNKEASDIFGQLYMV